MHSLILGMTESGKTTFAKLLTAELKSKGHKVAVLDPLQDDGWSADFQTNDSVAFKEYCKQNTDHFIFIDEGQESIGRYDDEMIWFAMQSRHWGHSCFFISCRAQLMNASMRHQSSMLILFAVSKSDLKLFCDEWCEDRILDAKLQKGEFFILRRFGELEKGQVDFENQSVYYEPVRDRQAEGVFNEQPIAKQVE